MLNLPLLFPTNSDEPTSLKIIAASSFDIIDDFGEKSSIVIVPNFSFLMF